MYRRAVDLQSLDAKSDMGDMDREQIDLVFYFLNVVECLCTSKMPDTWMVEICISILSAPP